MLKFLCCHLQCKNSYPVLSKWRIYCRKGFINVFLTAAMSNSHLYLPAGYPRAVLANGISRVICQLQRITIKFCKSHGSSRGVRDFIENDLVNFAKANPNIVVYVKPRRHRSPVFVAEYLNGERKWLSIHSFTRSEINGWLNLLKTQSGIPEMRMLKPFHTDNPSIQGPWNPFLFQNPEFNLKSKFPDSKFSLPKNLTPTATEILLEMAKNLQNNENNEVENEEQKLEPDVSYSKIEIKV